MHLPISSLLDRRTLIVGEINTGKTTLTRQILQELSQGWQLRSQILLLDLSPTIPDPLALPKSQQGIGGAVLQSPLQISDPLLYFCPNLLPPRLLSTTETEAQAIACSNRDQIEALLNQQAGVDRSIVIINDISLYLQAGQAQDLIDWISPAQTLIANGYWGQQLGHGALSTREREQMQILMGWVDQVISLPRPNRS